MRNAANRQMPNVDHYGRLHGLYGSAVGQRCKLVNLDDISRYHFWCGGRKAQVNRRNVEAGIMAHARPGTIAKGLR